MVGDLIALLDSDDQAIRCAAHWGLLRLTGQQFGSVAGDEQDGRRASVRKAQGWWDKNKAGFRFAPDAVCAVLDLGGGVQLEAVLIPAGKFLMGSPEGEKDRMDQDGPQHEVTISKAFYMGIYPVTQEQYEQVMGQNPSRFKGARNPVEQVSWVDALEFCKRLSQKSGRAVRLPTEAQREYACRAGSKTRYYYGDDPEYAKLGDYAWYGQSSGSKAHPAGQKKPNDWGLYDMHGNVWQWCADWAGPYENEAQTDPKGPASGRFRIVRGGGWSDPPQGCRSSARSVNNDPGYRSNYIGFRVVVDLE